MSDSTTSKIIIDTDPGIDDALAILLALGSPNVEVLGLTTIFGNSPIVRTMSDNAQKVLNLVNKTNVPVYEGAAAPLVIESNIEEYVLQSMKAQSVFIHGKDGLADMTPPLEGRFHPQEHDMPAAEFLIQQIQRHPNEITLIMLGPLTNLALAIMLCPNIVHKVKQVIVMGGAHSCPRNNNLNTPDANMGNISPVAEANIYKDPFAAHRVIHAGFTPNKLCFITLDLTSQTDYSSSVIFDYLKHHQQDSRLLSFLYHSHDNYADVYVNQFGRDSVPFHDSCAVYYAINPEAFTTTDVTMDIETTGKYTKGMTIISNQSNRKAANIRISNTISQELFYASILNSIKHLDE